MTFATGGSFCGATSTRSRPFPYAYVRASSVCLIPSCCPSSPIRRTRGTRIASLIRTCASSRRGGSKDPRRGLKFSSSSSYCPPSEMEKPLTRSGESSLSTCSVEPPRLALRQSSRKTLPWPSGGERQFRPCLSGRQRSKRCPQLLQRLRGLPTAVLTHRKRFVGFLVAVDDHERDLLDLGVADLLAHGLVGLVDLDPVRLELRGQRGGGLAVRLAHRDHTELHRREPERERAAVVLGEDADESLERSEQRAV